MNIRKTAIALATITIVGLSYNVVNATNVNEQIDVYETTTIKKVSETLYAQLENQLKDISKVVNEIYAEIDKSRTTEEFDTYPAIRLNIDTPYFGVEQLINNRLTITTDVSLYDITSGYSVNSVLDTKIVKLPIFDIAGLIVLTKDVKIDENLTHEDAKLITVKLLKYYEQAISVKELLDRQIGNIFFDYLVDDKKEIASNYKNIVNNTFYDLEDMTNKISYLTLYTDMSVETEMLLDYIEITTENEKKLAELLVTRDQLNKNYTDFLLITEDIKKFNEEIELKYTEAIKNIHLDTAIETAINLLVKEIEFIEQYMDSSVTKTESIVVVNEIETTEIKETINYATVSKHLYDNMNNDLEKLLKLKEDIDKYYIESNAEVDELDIDNEDSNDIKIYDVKSNSYTADKVIEINKIVNDFYNNEISYILDNIQTNVKEIKVDPKLNVEEYESLKYIYYDMQISLNKVSDIYNSKDIVTNIKSKDELKQVLTDVLEAKNKLISKDSEK